jgi:integron integrase
MLNQEVIEKKKPKLLDQVRQVIRIKHYSLRTEESYISWIKRFIFFHNKKHPNEMGEREIGQFITHLANNGKVSASTQNQALCAIIFLYKNVLQKDLNDAISIYWSKRPKKLPVVLSKDEVTEVLDNLKGTHWLIGMLLYGSGLRLSETLQLRVKDIDFSYNQIFVRDSKGEKDRITMLPQKIIPSLRKHLSRVEKLHQEDLRNGYGSVYLPNALERKYPNAKYELVGNMCSLQRGFQQTRYREYQEGIIYMIRLFKKLLSRQSEMQELSNRQVVIHSDILLQPICLNPGTT